MSEAAIPVSVSVGQSVTQNFAPPTPSGCNNVTEAEIRAVQSSGGRWKRHDREVWKIDKMERRRGEKVYRKVISEESDTY